MPCVTWIHLVALLCGGARALVFDIRQEDMSWDAVKATVIFIGAGRTGSSLVGSLLDAHPKMVVPNEFDLVSKVLAGEMNCSAAGIYSPLYEMSAQQANWRLGGGGYDYVVEGQWQGKVQDFKPYIVGDKKAGMVAELEPEELVKGLRTLANCTGRPLKIIHVERNPFDVVATRQIRDIQTMACLRGEPGCNHLAEDFMHSADEGTEPPKQIPESHMLRRIDHYIEFMGHIHALQEALEKDPNHLGTPAEVIPFDYQEFVADPAGLLRHLCDKLGVECTEDYVKACAQIVAPTDHYSRLYLQWDEEAVCYAMDKALENPLLARFMSKAAPQKGRAQDPRCASMCFPGAWPCPCAGTAAEGAGDRLDVCHHEG